MQSKYPCGGCKRACEENTNCIYCEACRDWFHIKCEQLTAVLFRELKEMPLGYWCRHCVHGSTLGGPSDTFNFGLSRTRFLDALDDSINILRTAARREYIFLRKTNLSVPPAFAKFQDGVHVVDVHVQRTIEKSKSQFNGITQERLNNLVPVSVPGDGSYLFHAASLALCGHTGLSEELRLRTLLEMCEHGDFYQVQDDDRMWLDLV
jgi:hypothetical protein